MTSDKVGNAGHPGDGDSKELTGLWHELCRIRNDRRGCTKVSNGRAVLQLHKALTDCIRKTRNVCIPDQRDHDATSDERSYYWNNVKSDTQSYFELGFDTDKAVVCGLLNQLPVELTAICIDNVAVVYAEHLLRLDERCDRLYGNDPQSAKRWKESKERQLLTEMISEFRHDHILSVALATIGAEQVVLGSLGVVHGFGKRKILETIGYDGTGNGPPSSIPTNFSLRFSVSDGARERLSDIQEEQVSELTRLCLFRNRSDDYPTASWTILLSLYTAIPRVVQMTYEIRFFEFNSKKPLHDSLVSLGYPIIIGGHNTHHTEGVLSRAIGDYFKDNANLLIPQFLDFDSTLELSHKFAGVITKG